MKNEIIITAQGHKGTLERLQNEFSAVKLWEVPNRDVALTWKESIYKPGTVKILPCELRDLEQSWEYFRRTDLHKLSAVDATSFAIMKRARIRLAYTFDHHFAVAGFRLVT